MKNKLHSQLVLERDAVKREIVRVQDEIMFADYMIKVFWQESDPVEDKDGPSFRALNREKNHRRKLEAKRKKLAELSALLRFEIRFFS